MLEIQTEGNPGEDSERKEESWRERLFLEKINNHEQNAGRNMDDKGHSGVVSQMEIT